MRTTRIPRKWGVPKLPTRSAVTDWTAVGARVREARAARGWSQATLGAATGNSQNQVTRLETGSERVSEEKLAVYADVLGLSLAFLRYGVAEGTDVPALRSVSYAEGWAAALTAAESVVTRELANLRDAAALYALGGAGTAGGATRGREGGGTRAREAPG